MHFQIIAHLWDYIGRIAIMPTVIEPSPNIENIYMQAVVNHNWYEMEHMLYSHNLVCNKINHKFSFGIFVGTIALHCTKLRMLSSNTVINC